MKTDLLDALTARRLSKSATNAPPPCPGASSSCSSFVLRPRSHRFDYEDEDEERGRSTGAFTLIELLVVIAIAGLLAALSIPQIKEFGRSSAERAATRQVLDDVARARQLAIANRSTVYMVFLPGFPNPTALMNSVPAQDWERTSQLLGSQLRAYALIGSRSVGDQPGQNQMKYLSEWKELPQGWIFPVAKFSSTEFFTNAIPGELPLRVEPFAFTNAIAFPFPSGNGLPLALPYIAFDYRGQLEKRPNEPAPRDETIPLAKGTVDVSRDPVTRDPLPLNFTTDVQENPPNNRFETFNLIHIDWLTGRARLLRREIE